MQYQEGQQLQGSDGKTYVVSGGVPRLAGAPQARGPVYGAPPKVEPYAAEDQGFQRKTNERAEADAIYRRERDRIQDTKDAAKPDSQSNQAFDNISSLRKEYNSLPEAKDYSAAMNAVGGMWKAPDNAQGDLAVIYGYAKAMDPGSVVREGEMDMANSTSSTVQDIARKYGKIAEGNRLPPEVRKQLIISAAGKARALNQAYSQQRQRYQQLAEQNGIDPTQILGNHLGDAFQGDEASFRQTSGIDAPMSLGDFQAQMKSLVADNTKPPEQRLQEALALAQVAQRGVDPAQIEAAIKAGGGNVVEDPNFVPPQLDAERLAAAEGPAGPSDLFKSGAVLGLDDEASGVGNMLANAITSPFTATAFDPGRAYTAGRDAQRMRIQQARQQAGMGGTALEIGGSLMSGNVSNALAVAPNLLGRMGQGARAGMVGGGLAGFGYGEGAQNSLGSAAAGAGLGAGFGAALPIAGQVVGNRIDGIRRLTGRDPALPRRIVNDAINADGTGAAGAGQMMDEAAQRGSPMMIADTGDNARGLLASVGRQPGASQRIVRGAVGDRQMAQGERMSEAVVRDLGPTANIAEMGEELITQARTQSRPFYEAFEAAPGASVVKLDDIVVRPAFKAALKKAVDLSQEMGDDPTALGFRFDAAGDMMLDRDALSWRAMDYVKQALDDVIEGAKDQRGNLTNVGRAAFGTKQTLVARMDKANPDYAKARAAYAGPAATRDAVEKGAKALNKTPDGILADMRRMGDAEQEGYRLGVRKAITDLIASKRDGGDKVAALIGTPKSRAALTRVFGGRSEFDRFVATLRDEQAMGQTHRAVFGGSPTAERSAVDATTNDTGLAETAVDAALRGGKDGMWSAGVAAIQRLREVGRYGAGEAGERTRESVAALLSETDPAVLRELIAAAREATRQQAALTGRQSRRAARIGRDVGVQTGGAIGSFAGPRQ